MPIIKQCFNKDDDDHVHNFYPIFFGMYGDRWKNIWGNRVKSRCLKQSKPKVPKIRDWRKYQDTFLFTENSNECIDFHGIPHPLDQDFQFRNNCGKGRCFKKGQKVFIELHGCVKNVCVDIMLTYLRVYYDDSGAEWHSTRPVE